MRTGRPRAVIVLTPGERDELEGLTRTVSRPDMSEHAEIVLLSDEGLSNLEVARRLGISAHTVGKWRGRFFMGGVRRLRRVQRPGGRRRRRTQCAWPW